MSDQLNGAQLPAATFEIRCGQFITSSRDAIPDLFGGYGRIAHWMSEFKIDVREKHHLDTVSHRTGRWVEAGRLWGWGFLLPPAFPANGRARHNGAPPLIRPYYKAADWIP